jgi:predicted aminopeptidase
MKYLWQAGKGQLEFSNRARPISEVIQDPHTPPKTAELLGEIGAIKKFGESEGLKPTKNYTSYVKLNRPASVWVVSACEKLAFKSKEWKFPIVGTFPYLGWFDLDDAKRYVEELRAEGWDADVRGARAFSTLGWFRDPVVSTMLPEGDEALGDLVNVVLHESVHATFYINDQSYFNESLANFVADHLTPKYLALTRGKDSGELKSYLASEREGEETTRMLHVAYDTLDQLYRSDKSESEKLEEKKKTLTKLTEELKFRREINNATLIQFRTYNVGTAEFEAIYKGCGESWPRFWKAIRKLDEKSFSSSQQEELAPVLGPLATGCPI